MEGETEVQHLAGHRALQNDCIGEQGGVIRRVPRVGLDKERPNGVFFRHRFEHRVLLRLGHQPVGHKAAGQQKRRAVCLLGQGLRQKYAAHHRFFVVGQAL